MSGSITLPKGDKHLLEDLKPWALGRETTARCAYCPNWSYFGTAGKCLEAQKKHREKHHPETLVKRRRPSSFSIIRDDSPRKSQGLPVENRRAIVEKLPRQPRSHWTPITIVRAYLLWERIFGAPPKTTSWILAEDGRWPNYRVVTHEIGGWPELKAMVELERDRQKQRRPKLSGKPA